MPHIPGHILTQGEQEFLEIMGRTPTTPTVQSEGKREFQQLTSRSPSTTTVAQQRITGGQPTRPLSPEDIQRMARERQFIAEDPILGSQGFANLLKTLGSGASAAFETFSEPTGGNLIAFANTDIGELIASNSNPTANPIGFILKQLRDRTPSKLKDDFQREREFGDQNPFTANALVYEEAKNRGEVPLGLELIGEGLADPFNIPGIGLARKTPQIARAAARGLRQAPGTVVPAARNVRSTVPITNVSPISEVPDIIPRGPQTARAQRPPRKITHPIEGTNQSVEFTPPGKTQVRPGEADIPTVVKSPQTPREAAAAKVDRRTTKQERTKKSPLVKKAIKAIKDTKIVRRATTALISEQRPARVARGIAASEGGPVRTQSRRFFGAQRGEFETFEPDDAIAKLFTDDEFDELVGMIRDPDIFNPVSQAFQMNTADRAFQKLFDENLLPTEGEIALLEEVFGGGFVRAALSKRTLGRKIWSGFLDVWNLPRAFIASGDLSGTLRQAGMLAAGNPRRFGQANAAQFRVVASKRNFLIEKELIESNPNFQRYTRKPSSRPGVQSETRLQLTSISGTSPLNAREEVYLSGFTDKIPIIRESQRAFVTLLNKLRMDVMDDMVGLIEVAGRKATETELDDIARFINNATGRGPLPVSQDIAALLNGIFFSSRLFTSRIALPFSVLSRSSTIRKKVAKDLVKAVGFVVTLEMMVKYSGAGEVETDPRSSDFGKLKFGKVRIDPWFGYQQIARLVGQLATGERKAVGTGSISELDYTDTVIRFLRSKMHPSAGAVWSLVDGENFLGDPFLPAFKQPFSEGGIQQPSDLLDIRKNPVFEGLAFLFVQDMMDAIAEDGLLSGFKAGAAGFSGFGAVTFTSLNDVAKEVHGSVFTNIYPFQQTEVRAVFNAQEDDTPERLKDGVTINPELPRSRQLDISRMDKLIELAELTGSSSKVAVPFLGLSPRQREQGRTIINDYFDIKAENAIRKDEARENLFGDTDYQQDSRGTLKEKAALKAYYDAIDESKSPAGRFLSDVWQKKREDLTRKWKAEGTLIYVQANTNTKPIPKRLEDFLRIKSKNEWQRIQDSKAAREVLNNRTRDSGPNPDNTTVDKPIKAINNVRPSSNRNIRP